MYIALIDDILQINVTTGKPRFDPKDPFGCYAEFKEAPGYQMKCMFENYFKFLNIKTCHEGYSVKKVEKELFAKSGKKCADLGIGEMNVSKQEKYACAKFIFNEVIHTDLSNLVKPTIS